MRQAIKYTSNKFYSKMLFVTFGSSYHADICSSAHCSDKFVLNLSFDDIKKGVGRHG